MNELEFVKEFVKTLVDEPTYKKWIDPLKYIGKDDDIVYIKAPDEKTMSWLKQNIFDTINTHSKTQYNCQFKLIPLQDDLAAEPQSSSTRYSVSNLSKRYTFESFVQSDSNRVAYSFAYSVSEFPGKSYNPLYIFSDVGLGKTHLMQAIGNRIIENNTNVSVYYITTSDFMNEYVEYARLNKRTDFLKKYTTIDVLLIDDIQYITKWGGTSEQFYYIFNNLIQQDKQVIMCSDTHPNNIPDLEKRIKSRFEMGSIVDILPYDLEARIAILKVKLDERRLKFNNELTLPYISDEVLYFLASSIKDNIRQLEGALNRLLGYADLKLSNALENDITLQFAKEALKPYINFDKKTITLDAIQEFVAGKFNISIDLLKSKNNSPAIALPRQIAMFLAKKLTKIPLTEIGHSFGGKHHTTVLHSVNKIEAKVQEDLDFAKKIHTYIDYFNE